MQVRVLGEVEVDAESPIALGGPNQRRMLAALAIRRGEVVSVPWLTDVVWPDGTGPARAEHNIRTYVHRLRAALGDDGVRIETVGSGYRLRLNVEELDAAHFEWLADAAASAADSGDAVGALGHIGRAEQLWLGTPLEEFEHEPWATPAVVRLRERRANLRERRAAALIEVGRPTEAIEVLDPLVRDEPLRERPRALLMRALYEAGRHPEALRVFQEFRTYLVDEIGVEPSSELVALDRSIASGNLLATRGPSSRRVGAYDLHEPIGAGAFAIVHRATQSSLGREVAVKIIRAEFANEPEFIRRFEAEAQMVARIEHPNIVPLYDYWREPDRALLAMRWMSGGSLASRLGDAWSADDALAVVDQIAAALEAAHRHGVVHRDVKPENILFDATGRAHLGDFGIAVEAARALPAVRAAPGSPTFASPEQLRSEPVGPEADVYALAMVASLLLTGGTPGGDSAAGILDVIAIATAERPADRYPSAEAFALALRGAASRPATVRAGPGGGGTNPFKGLNPFVESDAADFHGRERLVGELVKRLSDHDRLLAVVGPSGSGKSSVVRAGLVPAIRDGRVPGSSRWFVTTMIPGDQPFEALETALLRVAVNPPVELLAQLCDGPRGVLRSARRILPDDDGVVLLIIDQFEELFAADVSVDDRDAFLQAVAVAVSEPASPLRVVLTLRADFFDRPLRHLDFAPLIERNTVAIAPLAPDELERAIVTPAARVGVGFEAGLVSEIVADVNRHPSALPLMQYALTNAFEHSDRTTITFDDYRAIGGLIGALAQRAETIWQSATPEEQAATRRLFGRLVTLGEGRADTRRRVVRNELDRDPATNAMVERYGVARLLAFDHDPATREPTLEVAHEAVLREWPRLRAWLDEDRDALRVHRHLTAAATGWIESGRDSSELYGGSRLTAAEGLLEDRTALNPVETEFLEASLGQRAELEAMQHRRARRRWYLTTSIAIIAALAIIASVVALRQRDRADAQAAEARSNATLAIESGQLAETRAEEAEQARQEVEAERDRADRAAEEAESGRQRAEEATAAGDLQRLEAQAVRSVDVDPGLAALLAVEANRISGGSPSSADALQRVLSGTGGVEVRFPGVYGESRLSRDGATLVAFELRHIDVWDLPTRTLLHREEVADGSGTLTSFAITADASLVAYANLNGTHLLEVATGALSSVSDAVTAAIAFTSDGRELAVASGNAVEFWDVTSPSSPQLVDRRTFGESPVSHIAWNPTDDGYALVKDTTQEIEYWHRNDAEPVWTYSPTLGGNGRAGIPATLFSSDGASLIVANGEQKGSGAVVRKYATSDGAPYATSGGEETPPAGNTPASLNDLVWSDEPNGLVVGTLLPTGVFALDLSSGTAIPPPFEAPNAAWIGYSPALQRYVTSGLQGIEIRRPGSGPLERVVTLTPEQQVALDDGGAMYASISADANTAIAAVFHIPRHPQTVAFDLTTDPPAPREMGEQLLPVAVGDYTLMASPTTPTATGEIVLLDADLEPVGAPIETPTCTRMWKPSPDGRFFAVYCEYGSVNLYRSSGELVKAGLVVPDATPVWELVRFSFTSDGSRMFGFMQLGELQWAIWDTETGSLLDHGTRDELQRPIVVDDTLYVQRGVADFSLLQLDPDTFEPVGPPLVESLFPISEIAGDGRGELVAVTGLDGVTHVFDTATGSQLGREIPGNRNPNASFAADGTTLLVQSGDQVSVWNYDRTSWPDIACTLAGRNLTREEWEEWGPRTIEYRPTCPQFPADDAA